MDRKGILLGAGAYLLWGFFPIYFKALQSVPALEILSHRITWSFIFLMLTILAFRQVGVVQKALRTPRILAVYSIAGMLLAVNWLTYVWGVNNDHVIDTSLGYFINPLVSVALGVIFLSERLRPLQWVPIGIATIGVIYLTIQLASLPWIALVLAFTFGMYGLIKKTAPLDALHGLTLETGFLFLPALGYLLFLQTGSGANGASAAMFNQGLMVTFLLAISGVVTAIPLLMFASAARRIPLYMVGLLQYIAPTCQFLLGVLVYNEPFTADQLVGFSMIWMALLIYTIEGFASRRLTRLAPAD